MPQRDRFHHLVVAALEAEGWTITADPLALSFGSREIYVDLGADHPIGAEKSGQKIAVEIKSFLSLSSLHDLEVALGQYVLYREILAELDPERALYLAVPDRASTGVLDEPLGRLIVERQQIRIIVFREAQGGILRWML